MDIASVKFFFWLRPCCVTQDFDYSVTGRRNVLTLMTQLISVVIAFIYSVEKSKFNSNVERQYKFAHN